MLRMILVSVMMMFVFHKFLYDENYSFFVLAIILFSLLYDIYKKRSYKKPKQIIPGIAGALILAYILYTCETDNYFFKRFQIIFYPYFLF